MWNLLKKTLSVIISVSLLASVLVVSAAEDADYKLSYRINDDGKTVTVTGFEVEPTGDYDLVIPRKTSIDGKTYFVTAIADGEIVNERQCNKSPFGGYWKDGAVFNTAMKSLTLPNTLKTIGKGAFYACSGLTEIEIPDSVETIGDAAFCYCSNIRNAGVMPLSLKKIGVRAFSYASKISGVLNIPNADSQKNYESCMQVEDTSRESVIIFNEGITQSIGNIYGINAVKTVVFPSTLKKAITNNFADRTLRLLQKVYVLSDEFSFTGNALKIETGANAPSATKWYVRNDTVKENITASAYGIDPANVIVMDKNVVVFSENEDSYEIRETEQDSIILHKPEREGYEFEYWSDGAGIYFPGESYTVDKSVVLQAVWKKTYERENVLYKISHSEDGTAQIGNSSFGRIICKELANQSAEVTLTDENGYDEIFTAEFDDDGIWVNYETDSPYTEAKINGASEFDVLLEAEDGYERTVGLREPEILVYPRIDAVSDLSEFNWISSDVTVARVEGGVITGCKSGEAVITAEYGGNSQSIRVVVAGEIAIAKEQGTEAEYVAQKKPVIDAMNEAITDKSEEKLVSLLTGAGEIKLSDIKDIDTTNYESADAGMISEFASRIITYGAMEFDDIDDIVTISDILSKEFELGRLNHLTSVDEIDSVITRCNGYYGFDTGNKYYIRNKEDALEYFLNYTAVNLKETNRDFENAYVMSSVKNSANYSSLAVVIEECAEEIGYDKAHYDSNKGADMHKAIINDKNTIGDIDELKEYIDSYKKPEAPKGGGGSGGGGGSRKSSSVSFDSTYASAPLETNDTTPLFTDLENGRWSHNAVAYLVSQKVISGYEDGSFLPGKGVTRAEFIKIISSAFGFVQEDKESGSAENEETQEVTGDEEAAENEEASVKFGDVSEGDWYYPYIAGAFSANIITGDGRGNINPDAGLTRQEAAAIIYRTAGILGFETGSGKKITVSDISTIDDWAYTPVIQLMQMGILSGYEDSSFRPHTVISREEAAKIVYEMMQKANGGN